MAENPWEEQLFQMIDQEETCVGTNGDDETDPELEGACAAHRRIEGLFQLLKNPADRIADREPAETDALTPGTRLGEFEIIRPLSSGGMGCVYLARQVSVDRNIALKVCKPALAGDARMRSRFANEGKLLAQVRHPNVVPVLTSGEIEGHLFLAMEYVPGPTLADVFRAIANGTEPTASQVVARVLAEIPESVASSDRSPAVLDRNYTSWIVNVLRQVAEGLGALHDAGILHRDVKPANTVLDADGNPKIVDFGLAREESDSTVTRQGEFVGTPAYASPEQARGVPLTPASDVFSFGITMYESLSLHRPFDGPTAIDVLQAVINREPRLLRQVNRNAPPELEAIADKCLRKQPDKRYPSASSLAADLKNYVDLRPVSARKATFARRAYRRMRRSPWMTAFCAALFLSLTLGGWIAVRAYHEHVVELQNERERQFNQLVDEGDAALFRALTAQRPTWLPEYVEKYRQKAIDRYTRALELDPDAVWPRVERARLYMTKEATLGNALEDLRHAEAVQSGIASIPQFIAVVLDKQGKHEAASAANRRAKAIYPTNSNDLYWLGHLAATVDDNKKEAYRYFTACLNQSPNHYWARVERTLHGIDATTDQTIEDRVRIEELRNAKAMRPDLPFASELLVVWLKARKDRTGALKELDETIAKFGMDVFRGRDKGELLQQLGNIGAAESTLLKTLALDNAGQIAAAVADLKFRQKEYAAAARYYRLAIEQGNTFELVYVSLAESLTAQGKLTAAQKTLESALAADPHNARLHNHLGNWYSAHSKKANAEQVLRKAVELPASYRTDGGVVENVSGIGLCVMSLDLLLAENRNHDERIAILQKVLARFRQLQADNANSASQRKAVLEGVVTCTRRLGQAFAGARQFARLDALISSNTENQPLSPPLSMVIAELFQLRGNPLNALAFARSAEYALLITDDKTRFETELARIQLTGSVNSLLVQLHRYDEYVYRLETRRKLEQRLGPGDYQTLAAYYSGRVGQIARTRIDLKKAIQCARDGVKEYPDAIVLHRELMHLYGTMRKNADAEKEYDATRRLYLRELSTAGHRGFATSPDTRQETHLQGSQRIATTSVFTILDLFEYLLRASRIDECRRLESEVRSALLKIGKPADHILYARAIAESRAGMHLQSIPSLTECLKRKVGSEAFVVSQLANSYLALNRLSEALPWVRRSFQMRPNDPGRAFVLFTTVLQVEGRKGIEAELPKFANLRSRMDIRLNTTLSCLAGWLHMKAARSRESYKEMIKAGPYLALALKNRQASVDEIVAWAVLLKSLYEFHKEKQELKAIDAVLQRLPKARIEFFHRLFSSN